MNKLHLQILGVPFAKQSFRFAQMKSKSGQAFIAKYQPKKVKEGEANVRTQIIEQLPKGFIPWTQGVQINWIHFKFPILKSMSKREKSLCRMIRVYKTTKPDLTDNLMKGLFDAMKGIVFNDDSQICQIESVIKVYSDTPMIDIELEEMVFLK